MRRCTRIVGVALLCLVAAEATARVYYARSLGWRVLLFGTNRYRNVFALGIGTGSVQRHDKVVGDYHPYRSSDPTAYAKYFPNEVKLSDSPDRRESYQVRINNQGFRGKDFAVEKEPGTKRVLTLGASSTFGYHNRDDETYPYYLEQLLNADGRGRFEVINFAIPHATSANIAAMLLAEGLALEPDFVTFYEGVNDAAIFVPEQTDPLSRAWAVVANHLLLAQLADQVLRAPADSPGQWTEEVAAARTREFLHNLDVIARACAEHGIRFIVATQQAKSQLLDAGAMRGVTYAQEVALIEEKLARGELGRSEKVVAPRNPVREVLAQLNPARILFVHARLMRALRAWAPAHDVQLVDVQAALDQRRDLILTWVHLAPEANRIVAAVLAEQILADAFPPARDATAAAPPAS